VLYQRKKEGRNHTDHVDWKTKKTPALTGTCVKTGNPDRKKEVDERLIAETEAALACHELIKVKVLENCGLDRHEASEALSAATTSDIAQVLGKTFLLYRPAEKPVIVLP